MIQTSFAIYLHSECLYHFADIQNGSGIQVSRFYGPGALLFPASTLPCLLSLHYRLHHEHMFRLHVTHASMQPASFCIKHVNTSCSISWHTLQCIRVLHLLPFYHFSRLGTVSRIASVCKHMGNHITPPYYSTAPLCLLSIALQITLQVTLHCTPGHTHDLIMIRHS